MASIAKAVEQTLKSGLVRFQAFVNGAWIDAKDRRTFSVTNPADGSHLGDVPDMSTDDARSAIDAAYEAKREWAKRTSKERSGLLRRWFDLVRRNRDDLARIITAEQGKPLNEAKGEVDYGASFIEWYSEEAKRVYGDVLPSVSTSKRLFVLKEPVGVAALITPWNFPFSMVLRKASAALAAGCTAVVKPAEDTPLCALALAKLAEDAGIPAGVYNTITCSRDNVAGVGEMLAASEKIAMVSFTGSTAVGKLLLKHCASNVTKVSMELGGQAAFIVFDSADADAAVEGAANAKFRNAGQACIAANRFLVQEGIHDLFCEKLKVAMEKLSVGNGFEEGVTVGPLINQRAAEKVMAHVTDAISKGGKVLCGGDFHHLGRTFFKPTLLSHCTVDMLPAREETFGPIIPVFKFKTEEEALKMANSTQYGLASYFYSTDFSQIWRVAESLECGVVGVNEGSVTTEVAPFGGVKQSGIGKEGSKYGIEEFLHTKYICMGNIK